MRLVLLEGLERVEVRVLVVEPDHEADGDQVVVGQVVQERPAVLRGLQRKRVLRKCLSAKAENDIHVQGSAKEMALS